MTPSFEAYGPLKHLIGTWEGHKGADRAPSDDRGVEKNLYRERMVFEPIGEVHNHEQTLFGLRYKTMAWRIGEDNSFHEELGYWLWDAKEQQVMRCFMIPRGVAVIAGGTVDPRASSFSLSATLGSPTYGICSNLFLDRELKTVRYELRLECRGSEGLTYEEETHLQILGQSEIFIHSDKNTLQRVT